MRRYPQTDKLRERVRQCLPLAQPWKGTMYRATTLEYANRGDLLAGVGSRKAGARWTPPGTFNAVYASLEPETAMAEALANYRDFGIPISEAMPLVFVAVEVKVQALLDLTVSDVQQMLRILPRKMIATAWEAEQERGNEALTQAIGRIAWEEKLEGLLVPSARQKGAANIVLFPGRRRRGSSWKIHRARKLPRKDDA
jgi:RES domain-containing protein